MQKPERGISLPSNARTSTGQVRPNNEDSIHLWAGDDFVLAIIADGMGGAAAGEEASRIPVETIKAGFNPNDTEDTPVTERLQDSIHTANVNIVQKAAHAPEMRGMGTTLTLVFIRGTYATFAHVGTAALIWLNRMMNPSHKSRLTRREPAIHFPNRTPSGRHSGLGSLKNKL